MLLIGIDCATDDAKIGLARGAMETERVRVDDLFLCGKERSALDQTVRWLERSSDPAVIAIDAPLGWPMALGSALAGHHAGDEITDPANQLFRRSTDRFIKERTNKTPLDVGADRIARTAHAALRLLGDLRRRLNRPIPLAWSADVLETSAIEVYPATTLMSRNAPSTGYKKPEQRAKRQEIITALSSELDFGEHTEVALESADALDAGVCLLAAADFLRGDALPPTDRELARSEGWIWTKVQPLA